MDRRRFLELCGVVGLAGCLGRSSDSNRSPSTDGPTTTPSPGVETRVTIPPCPERPDERTRESVLGFATRFERAYLTRSVVQEHDWVTSVDIDIGGGLVEKTATRTTDGWVARFTVNGPAYRYRPDPESTDTAHVDPPLYVANYLITDRTVWRARATEAVDPRENGSEVTCPPA